MTAFGLLVEGKAGAGGHQTDSFWPVKCHAEAEQRTLKAR